MADIYNAEDVIDKTLFARTKLDVYDGYPSGTYKPKKIGFVNAGNSCGIVYSWISADPSQGRQEIWWMFSPAMSGGKYYFIPHKSGAFDLKALRQQGVISTAEKIEEEKKKEEEANKPWWEKLMEGGQKTLTTGLWIAGGAFLLSQLIKSRSNG